MTPFPSATTPTAAKRNANGHEPCRWFRVAPNSGEIITRICIISSAAGTPLPYNPSCFAHVQLHHRGWPASLFKSYLHSRGNVLTGRSNLVNVNFVEWRNEAALAAFDSLRLLRGADRGEQFPIGLYPIGPMPHDGNAEAAALRRLGSANVSSAKADSAWDVAIMSEAAMVSWVPATMKGVLGSGDAWYSEISLAASHCERLVLGYSAGLDMYKLPGLWKNAYDDPEHAEHGAEQSHTPCTAPSAPSAQCTTQAAALCVRGTGAEFRHAQSGFRAYRRNVRAQYGLPPGAAANARQRQVLWLRRAGCDSADRSAAATRCVLNDAEVRGALEAAGGRPVHMHWAANSTTESTLGELASHEVVMLVHGADNGNLVFVPDREQPDGPPRLVVQLIPCVVARRTAHR